MSERSFLRRFSEAAGMSSGEWLTGIRVEEAERLLETTAFPTEEVGRLVGLGSPANLLHHFGQATDLNPRQYRESFGTLRPTAQHKG